MFLIMFVEYPLDNTYDNLKNGELFLDFDKLTKNASVKSILFSR